MTPAEVAGFKYMNHDNWTRLSSTRLVADGVPNFHQSRDTAEKVNAIADLLRQGTTFEPLIAAKRAHAAEVVLMEGHHRATAYAMTGLPVKVDVFIGTSAHMDRWVFV